jgi:dTDP-4-amino-4,6-dideoxygalactose transaminase
MLESRLGGSKVFLTPSCTAALEMAAVLLDLQEGDEVIVPSFAFVTTVNSFVLHGATPVFVDIREDTLNLNEEQIESLISPKTRAIVPLHYAGVGCEMDRIMQIAEKHNISVVEDAAQALGSTYSGRQLGTMGRFGCYSFHETKNFTCGEGGAIAVNDVRDVERAEIIRQKGTDRTLFHLGIVNKYTWQDLGASFVLSDILAAFLLAQLEQMDNIMMRRKEIFDRYRELLEPLQSSGKVRLPYFPDHCMPNYHMFYLLFEEETARNRVLDGLKSHGILAVFHYIPLHSSPYAERSGFKTRELPVTDRVSRCILRLPFYNSLTMENIEEIAHLTKHYL